MQEEISLMDIWQIFKKNAGVIVATTIAGFLIAFIATFFLMTPLYQSESDILVSRGTNEEAGVNLSQDINASLQLINTYSDIITNEVILIPVSEQIAGDFSVPELREMISVESKSESQVFSIVVESEDPNTAAEIANTTAQVFSEEIGGIMNVENVTIISQAFPNPNPVSPNKALNLLVGILVGFVLGAIIALIRELTDNTIKSEEFVIEEIGWPMLGRISVTSDKDFSKSDRQGPSQVQEAAPLEEDQPTSRKRSRSRV